MAVAKTFLSFEEIKADLMAKAPSVVYKYRSWNSDQHKSLLLKRVAWFAHPFDLNDPLDVRPETVFDPKEFYDPRYLDKMIVSGLKRYPSLSLDEVKSLAEKQLKSIQNDPEQMLNNWKTFAENRSNYNGHGVFSVSTMGLSEPLWSEYGDEHRGYALGFKTVDLCLNMKSAFGFVEYDDEPYKYSFLATPDDDLRINRLFLKKTKYAYESEFRFVTVGVGSISTREQVFRPDVVDEVLLGANMSEPVQKEVVEIIKSNYPDDLKVFKIIKSTSGLTKRQIR